MAARVSDDSTPAIAAVRSYLGQRLFLWTDDGRVIRGRFSCLDHLANLILDHAVELRPANRDGREVAWNDEIRPLLMGSILMPMAHVVQAQIEDVL